MAKKESDQPTESEVEEPAPMPEVKLTKEEHMINQANDAAERLENANRELREVLAKQEELNVEKTLGGTADAGETEKVEETPQEYAARVMKGDTSKK